MNRPPLVLRLAVANQRHHLSLWLPLFLILPIVALVALVLIPIIILIALILLPFGWGKPLLFSGPIFLRCLCELRGLEVDLKQDDQLLLVSFK